jgi:hypothetical protein
VVRIARAWQALSPERRLAAAASLALFVTLFLPWYRVTVVETSVTHYRLPATQTFSGWGAFSFVEAAVLLVAISVLALLFYRAEGRAFHLPGGDGWVIGLAGLWTCFLVIWRMFDKQGVTSQGQVALSSGIEWGIFVTLAVAALLAYAGNRVRAAHQPEPPLPTEEGAVFDGRWHAPGTQIAPATPATRASRRRRERSPAARAAVAAPKPRDRPRRAARSSWRPADQPEWSESERPVGWLSAPPERWHSADAAPEPEPPAAEPDTGQLTIPLDDHES